MNLLDIIIDYQETAEKIVNILKEEFKVDDLIQGWRRGRYRQTGKLEKYGIKAYAFHGIGLFATLNDKSINFDFGYSPDPRWDGFDLWRLKEFIAEQPKKYNQYLDKNILDTEFRDLIEKGIIVKPQFEQSTNLYFLAKDLK